MIRLMLLLLTLSMTGWGQTALVRVGQNNTYTSGYQNFNAATFGLPTGASDPVTCSVGDRFVNTTTTPGIAKTCLTTNTWTIDILGTFTNANAMLCVSASGVAKECNAASTFGGTITLLGSGNVATVQGAATTTLAIARGSSQGTTTPLISMTTEDAGTLTQSILPVDSYLGAWNEGITGFSNSGALKLNYVRSSGWNTGPNGALIDTAKPGFAQSFESHYTPSGTDADGTLEAHWQFYSPLAPSIPVRLISGQFFPDGTLNAGARFSNFTFSNTAGTSVLQLTGSGLVTLAGNLVITTGAGTGIDMSASTGITGIKFPNNAFLSWGSASGGAQNIIVGVSTDDNTYLTAKASKDVIIAGGAGGSVGIGANVNSYNPTGTLQVHDGTATTGVTRSWIREGAGQSTNEVWGIYANDGTTKRISYANGILNIAGNGAASNSPFLGSGTWFTGGSATTTKPYLLVEPTGTTSTAWSTSGTGLGVNAASGFAGNLLDLQVAEVSKFKVDAAGAATFASGVQIGASNTVNWASGSYVFGNATSGAITGAVRIVGGGSATIVNFGGDTSSFPALKRSTTGLIARLADDSADTFFRSIQVAGGGTPSVGTCGTIGTGSLNNAGFITSGTTGSCVSVVTFTYTATTGWSCGVQNSTTLGATNMVVQTGSSTTTATFTGTTVSGDVITYMCMPY